MGLLVLLRERTEGLTLQQHALLIGLNLPLDASLAQIRAALRKLKLRRKHVNEAIRAFEHLKEKPDAA